MKYNYYIIYVFSLIFIFSALDCKSQAPGGVSSGLTGWFKADGGTTVTLNAGGYVSAWRNSAANPNVPIIIANSATSTSLVNNTAGPYNFNNYFQLTTGCLSKDTTATNDLVTATAGSILGVSSSPDQTVCITSQNTSACTANRCCAGMRTPGAQFGNTQVAWNTAATQNTNKANLFGLRADISGQECTRNGFSAIGSSGTRSSDTYRFAIGSFIGFSYTGSIAEAVLYNRQLTPTEFSKVQSYLAAKFGITLGNNVSPQNYLASNSTIYWNASNTYQNRITVIGRDDSSGLSQRQSRSVHNGSMVELYNGNTGGTFPVMNQNNTNTFNNNISYLAIGDDNGDTTLNICIQHNTRQRMARVWKVQQTGINGTVTLAVNDTVAPARVRSILVSSSVSFPDGGTIAYNLTDNGTLKYAALTLNNGDYFTFADDSAVIAPTNNGPLCEGATLQLSVTIAGGGKIQWFGPGGFSDTVANVSIPNVTPNNAGTYYVMITRNNCVLPVGTTVADIYPKPEAAFSTEVLNGCEADTVILSNTSTPFINYTWDFGDGQTGNINDTRHAYTKTGTYHVTLIASDGHCSDTITHDVDVAPLGGLVVNITNVVNPRCFGQKTGAFDVELENGLLPFRYSLDGQNAVGYKNFADLPAGEHVVKVTDMNGCTGSDTVNIQQPVLLSVSVSDIEADYCRKGSANGSATVLIEGGTTPYQMTLNNEEYTDGTHLVELANGNYNIQVRDANQCDANTSFEVAKVACCVAKVPSAFSPNADGLNDILRPVNSGINLVAFDVYNRWGIHVFSSNDVTLGWDGTYEGAPQDMATYFYTIRYVCLDDNEMRSDKGDFTMIR